MPVLKVHLCRLFDGLQRLWEHPRCRMAVGWVLILTFAGALLVIEAARQGWIPDPAKALPRSHFYAISAAFTVLLYVEVIDLVFGLSRSFSDAVGKQFEIFALILLRQPFKELTLLPEPLAWPADPGPLTVIAASALGALAIFAILHGFQAVLGHPPLSSDSRETQDFVAAKKVLALGLLVFLVVNGLRHLSIYLSGAPAGHFFDTFYTVLVFCDVLIVLLSLRHSHRFTVVFRNSAFVMATVLLRLGLTAPPTHGAVVGVGAALYVLAVAALYRRQTTMEPGSGHPAAPPSVGD